MTATPQHPTLSGAERGRVRPLRQVKGGIWLIDPQTDQLKNEPCALRVLRQRETARCEDLARQYLLTRGDGQLTLKALEQLATILAMHLAVVSLASVPGQKAVPLYPGVLAALTDDKGKLVTNAAALIEDLPLQHLAEGQLQHLLDEYQALLAVETPATISHEQWEAIVREGKAGCEMTTLISRHGCSALIQVLAGTDERLWQTSPPSSSGASTP